MGGPISKAIAVMTNCEGALANVTIMIKGEVWQPIQATPPAVAFGSLRANQIATQSPSPMKVAITSNVDAPAKLTLLKCNSTYFKPELKTLEEGKKYELSVALVPPLPPGSCIGNIDLETGVADQPRLTISASAFVMADLEVTPNQMMLPATSMQPTQRLFYIRNNTGKPIKLTDLAISNPDLKITQEQEQVLPGAAFRLTLDVPANFQLTQAGEEITFKTDCPGTPSVTIPIKLMVATAPTAARRATGAVTAPIAAGQPKAIPGISAGNPNTGSASTPPVPTVAKPNQPKG